MTTLKYKTQNGYRPLPAMVVRKTNAENGNGIGTCSTSSGTALTVSLTGYEPVQNGFIAVTFANDVPANATLNVNGKGAKPIYYKGSAITADTIKADDTVTFCYDGTNYVVTSLGGRGGTIVWPEFVTIHLTSTVSDIDSNLIGATVVVTDDDTSETILSTTWQGSDIAVQINSGVDYTVTVGNITDYAIRPNYKSYTAQSALARLITFEYIGNAVDLGLPSGLLWCTHNVGASNPDDYGLFFSWGNTDGYSYNSGHQFTDNGYSSTTGSTLSADIVAGSSNDAARANMGGDWRMPSNAEFTELNNNCAITWTTVNGKNGILFTSNINSKTLFLPLAGALTSSHVATNCGYYKTLTYVNSTQSGGIKFEEPSSVSIPYSLLRWQGMPIRPVM